MLPLLLFGGATAALAPREPCVELQLQNEAVTAVFDGWGSPNVVVNVSAFGLAVNASQLQLQPKTT